MKTAVSIPDDVFEAAERLAGRRGVSRSELYATALRSLLSAESEITDQLNRVHRADSSDAAVTEAARRVFTATEW